MITIEKYYIVKNGNTHLEVSKIGVRALQGVIVPVDDHITQKRVRDTIDDAILLFHEKFGDDEEDDLDD